MRVNTKKIQKLMREQHLLPEELARYANLPYNTVAQVATGGIEYMEERFGTRLAYALGVEISQITR